MQTTVSCPRAGQAQADPAVEPPMIGGVRLLEIGIRLCGRGQKVAIHVGRERPLPTLNEVPAATTIVAAFAPSTRMRSGNVSCVPPSFRIRADARNARPSASRELSDQIETIVAGDLGARILLSIDPRAERERAWPVDRQSHHDHPVGMADEHFARVANAVDTIGHARDRGVEIQLAPVVADGRLRDRRSDADRRGSGTTRAATACPSSCARPAHRPRAAGPRTAAGARPGAPSAPRDCRSRGGRPSRAFLR